MLLLVLVVLVVVIEYCWRWFFFFQAEDGIRDLVRSRGLGDVYKRQGSSFSPDGSSISDAFTSITVPETGANKSLAAFTAVSYTHLTLPTSDLV